MPSHLRVQDAFSLLGRSRGSSIPSYCWVVLEGPGCLLIAGSF